METDIEVHYHPVEFLENLKVDGEKEEICGVCDDPVSRPCYKCSTCNFLCHESCGNLPFTREHLLHPNHTPHIEPPSRHAYCDACGKSCKRCFFYYCGECKFILDTKCISRLPVDKDDGHQHTFVPLLKQIQFTCEGCGEERKDIGRLCNKCQLLTHTRCALFSETINLRKSNILAIHVT